MQKMLQMQFQQLQCSLTSKDTAHNYNAELTLKNTAICSIRKEQRRTEEVKV